MHTRGKQIITPFGGGLIIKKNLISFAGNAATDYRRISLLLLLGLALTLRIHHLDHESLWMDEIRQASFYTHSLTDLVDNAASQGQPPLDYWIGHFVHFFSGSDFAVRLPAALFGTASVLLLVVLISQISSWPVACGFGIVYALMPFNLCFSQEARPYAIAVFLFLCTLWTLNRFLSIERKKKLLALLTLLFFSTIFLYSRSLSPLVVVTSLLLILIIWFFYLVLKAHAEAPEKKNLVLLSGVTLLLALVIYLPALRLILAKSGRYVADTSLGIPIEKILATIINLDLSPIWRAYVAQSEPVTYPLLALVCLSPFLGWKMGLHRKNSLWVIASFLLPLACTLNLIIFQSKSSMPFRPSYVSYLLPLVFILGAVSIQGLWTLSVKAPFVYISRGFVLFLAVFLTFQSVVSAIEYKKMRRKTDWRGVTAFLAENYDSRHLLIFDGFSRYGSWEPTFYGFPRYYRGRSSLASIKQIPFHAPQMAQKSLTPILIVFQWRLYYLTPQSTYPVISVVSPGPVSLGYQRICRDPGLICTEFTGFSVIELREKSNNLARDTYDIIERLLLHFPRGSWNVELHLAAAALGRAIQLDDWHHHLKQAEHLTHSDHLPRVKHIAKIIRASKRQ